MTLPSIAELIAKVDPLTPHDRSEDKERQMREECERVRQRSAALYSSRPLYQARTAKDPEYRKTFSGGGVR